MPPEGCLRLDPTPPPPNPNFKLRFRVTPELFALYPPFHKVVGSYKNLNNAFASAPCRASEQYNYTTGAGTLWAGTLGALMDGCMLPALVCAPYPLVHCTSVFACTSFFSWCSGLRMGIGAHAARGQPTFVCPSIP